MNEFIQKILDYLLGPEAVLAEPGFDPSTEGLKKRAERKTMLIVALIIGGIAFCILSAWGVSAAVAAAQSTPTPTATEFGDLGTPTPSATLPGPGVSTEIVSAGSVTEIPNALTLMAQLPTNTASPTQLTVGGILTDIATTATPCATSDHFLTELACNDLAMTSTIESAGVGTPINVSGVDPRVTVIYPTPYPPTQTPWIVSVTPSQTPVVITATPGPSQTPIYQVVTATPGPTQTPWFYITQPPVVTVVWTQIVTVEVTREVTVVVTPTETASATPTETPTP